MRMTFVLGVNSQYRHRLPCIGDFLHMLIPNMWPERYDVNQSALSISLVGMIYTLNPNSSLHFHFLGRQKISDFDSPQLFSAIVLDVSSPETELFANDLKVSFFITISTI